MKKIRIGHIGVAHDHAKPVLECALSYPDVFEFVGLCEPNPKIYEERIANDEFYRALPFMSVEELLAAKPDAVLVEGYELDNVDVAIRCAEAGIHIHLDKPAGDDLDKFAKLLEIAKKNKVAVQMGYMYRYNHAVQYCLEKIKDGTLGEVYQVDAFMDTCHDPEKRMWMKDFPGGNMFFLGCHMVDFVYLMMGAPKKVIPFNRRTHIDGTDVVDHACAVLDYGNAVSTVRATSTQVNGFGRRQLVVCGTKGSIEIKPLEIKTPGTDMLKTKLYLSTKEMVGEDIYNDHKVEIEIEPMIGRYNEMLLEFAEIVRGEKENPYDYDYEYEVHKLVLEACQE